MVDSCSLSNLSEIVVTHFHWSAEPDFSTKSIAATIDIKATVIADNVENLILDSRDLEIVSVSDTITGASLDYELRPTHPVCQTFGSPLVIVLPREQRGRGSIHTVSIKYKTLASGAAVQWLDPVQTAGKQHPYLFTQCQAIHARSLLPCQDSPGVKSSYTAEVNVPEELNVVMGAVREGETLSSGRKICKFSQNVPIPSYLFALAVGAIESRKIGPRSHVWSEKEIVDKAAYEFAEAEQMVQVAESIVGPYVWGESCDILVPPPSFPYGGMENPNMIFATPTLLAGDRSLVTVIAHEISHSWTGNLVTNRTWDHFWLNEGFTRYLERLIVEELYGSTESTLQLMLGWKSLQDSINRYGPTHPLTALVPTLGEVDPDDAFSSVPYEKGCAFLCYLESLVGLKEMKVFLRAYIDHFKYKTVDTDQWKDFFMAHFESKKDVLAQVDWKAWLYNPGMPPYNPQFDPSANSGCITLAERWSSSSEEEQFSESDLGGFSSSQQQEFLNKLLLKEPFPLKKLEKMEKVYKFNSSTNDEITFRWLRLCLKGEWTECFPLVVAFLLKQGRMKYVRPLYRELHQCSGGGGKQLALGTFEKNKQIYHGILAMMVSRDLGLEQ